MINSTVAVALIGVAVVYCAAQLALHSSQGSKEPRVIETAIPFFTPLKVFRDNMYFAKLRKRFLDDIYTLRIPKLHVYVVNSLDLIAAVEKEFKLFTFQIILDQFGRIVCEMSPAAIAAQDDQTNMWLSSPKAGSDPSPTAKSFQAITSPHSVREMSRVMLDALAENAEDWVSPGEGNVENVKWLDWITEQMTIATTDGVYGPKNPYRDPRVRKAFWTYNKGVQNLPPVRLLSKMGLGWLGGFLVGDTFKARSFLASTFDQYFSCGDYLQASDLTRDRYEWYTSKGFPLRDHANLEAGFGIAIIANTVPTAFWATLHILSDPIVLEACRSELLAQVTTTISPDGTTHRTFDVSTLKTKCPILNSAFQESMRVHSLNVSFRAVRQDYLLNGTHLLKKGNLIMMPATVRHFDPTVWGPDPESYHYDRFLKRPHIDTARNFRAWGGGVTKCPGRHFATLEILIVTAMLLLRFEVKPQGNQREWTVPTTKKAGFTSVMPYPDFDVEVGITQRKEDVGVRWCWEFSRADGAA